MAFIERNGKQYEIVNGIAITNEKRAANEEVIYAEKSGYVLVSHLPVGTKITVHTSNGNVSVEEVVQEGCLVLTRVNKDGSPVLDAFDRVNRWQIAEDVLRKKYDIGAEITDGMIAKPAGGTQKFLVADKDIALLVPWGENGALVYMTVDAGGYINITDLNDIYGIAKEEFESTYEVLRKGTWEDQRMQTIYIYIGVEDKDEHSVDNTERILQRLLDGSNTVRTPRPDVAPYAVEYKVDVTDVEVYILLLHMHDAEVWKIQHDRIEPDTAGYNFYVYFGRHVRNTCDTQASMALLESLLTVRATYQKTRRHDLGEGVWEYAIRTKNEWLKKFLALMDEGHVWEVRSGES